MLSQGEVINNTYKIVREIGSGGMGIVFLAYHTHLEKYVVLKRFKSQNFNDSMLRNEVDILKRLHHPYLPQVYDYIIYNSYIYTVIDYINGYDLDYYAKSGYMFTEQQLLKWFKQLCEVLIYLHSQNQPIIHSDIKPANIIINENNDVCLIDFGISLSADDVLKGFSKNYSSPEQYENVCCISSGVTPSFVIGVQTDIYSLGATFYYLMTGVEPNIVDGEFIPIDEFNLNYSEAFVSVISKAMNFDINKRFKTAEKMLNAVVNLKKQDRRYKKYIALQFLCSIISGIMIFSGISLLTVNSFQQTESDFYSKYDAMVNYYNKGNADAAINEGCDLIKSSKYDAIIDESQKAEILHIIGECFFEKGDYSNAENYYVSSIEFEKDNDKQNEFYRDYAAALINLGKGEEAKRIVANSDDLSKSNTGNIINAEIAFKDKNYSAALEFLNNCYAPTPEDDYSISMLYGDIFYVENDLKNAVFYYEKAVDMNKNLFALRKLANSYLALAGSSNYIDYESLNRAKDTYTDIMNNYYYEVNDVINLSQVYRLTGDYSNCETVLVNSLKNYPQDYRIYFQLVFMADESKSPQITMYCEEARKNYKNASEDEKNFYSDSDVERIKQLYQQYCGKLW